LAGTFVDYLEATKTAFREKRFIVRELKFDSSRAGGVDSAIEQANNELKQVKSALTRWCRAHFGEVLSGYVHLRVVQAFTESVLTYGLPAEFASFFAISDGKAEKETQARLARTIYNIKPELRPRGGPRGGGKGEEDEEEETGFVCLRFPLIGASTGSN
jgi:V-type H+-transporting ATPase subunit C